MTMHTRLCPDPRPCRRAFVSAARVLAFAPALFLALSLPGVVRAGSCPDMGDLVNNGAFGVADQNGKILAECNLDDQLMPASIIKVATVLAAMRILGPDFRFKTEFYRDKGGNLYIRGYGDPSLVSEEVALMAERLQAGGLKRVETLFVDDFAFALEGGTPGQSNTDNPYDAPVAALAVNFNTMALGRGKQGEVISGEPQTPTLPLMLELAKKHTGAERFNICFDGADPRERSARYAGELFGTLFQQKGITVKALGGIRRLPDDADLVLRYADSKNLREVSADLMRSSSNFIANLIFLQAGMKKYGLPATWDKARRAVKEALEDVAGERAALRMVEGSGLSRDDKVSARVMLKLLERFRPYKGVMKTQNGVALKSGTLTGVYNLAGYLSDGKAYVIMLNQSQNTRDRVLNRLVQRYSPPPPTPAVVQPPPEAPAAAAKPTRSAGKGKATKGRKTKKSGSRKTKSASTRR